MYYHRFLSNGKRCMSIQGGSETYQECLLMKCRAVTSSTCEMRRRAWRASDMRQEITCFTCCFCFHSPFFPSLCARDGFVGAPPACREKAEIRRKVWGQIWSGIDLKPFFQNFSYFRSFNPVEQLSTGTRNMEILLESNDIDT